MESTATAASPRKRPDFLTVLCILTFIGSGFGLVSALTNYANADVLTEIAKDALDQSKEKVDEDLEGSEKGIANKVISGAASMMDPVKLKQNYLLTFVSNLITLSGAFLMFRLKKAGFWLYVAGTLMLVVTPVIIFGPGNLFSLGLTFLFGIIGILFIVLYSLNLKYLGNGRTA